MSEFTKEQIAKMMDHAVLKPAMTDDDIRKNAKMCVERGVGDLCVRPTDTKLAAELVKGSGTTVAVVVGFPHGASRPEVKALEAKLAIEDGANELDMVMNIGKFLSGDYDWVVRDIKAVVDVARPKGIIVKVIQESCLLTLEQVAKACELSIQAGADFVKTSTGFGPAGATVEDVRLMREAVGPTMGVKPAGGVRTLDTALDMIRAGATRIGTSNGIAIVEELTRLKQI